MVLPIIFLIDLDGTIHGDCASQVQEYTLLEKLGSRTTNKKFIERDYKNGLLRPYFASFMKTIEINRRHTNIETFIYTASEKKWAQYVVPVIENVVKARFNRPIFHRDYCDMEKEQHKSILTTKKHIFKSLKYKYDLTSINDLTNRIYLIDNNNTLEESDFLLKCPTYDHIVQVDLLRQISFDDKVLHHELIVKKILGDNIQSKSVFHMMKIIYKYVLHMYKQASESNQEYKNDDFWKNISILIHTVKDQVPLLRKMKSLCAKY